MMTPRPPPPLLLALAAGCGPKPPASVVRLMPRGIEEHTFRVGRFARPGFAAPIGGHWRIPFEVPVRDPSLVLSYGMLPDGPGGAADQAIFMAELRDSLGQAHQVLRSTGCLEQWTESTVDLRPFAGQEVTLFIRSESPGNTARGFACWGLPLLFRGGKERPNIILISLDTVRADHLHCYGYHRPTSPTLDSLAARGWLFRNVVAQSSWTLPSHASLFSSLHLSSHGVTTWDDALPQEIVTLPEVLRGEGYLTGAVIGGALGTRYGLNQGFDTYDTRCFTSATKSTVTNPCTHTHAVEWLRTWGHAPFFLFLHYWDVHDPYVPPAPFDTLFDPGYHGSVKGWETLNGWEALLARFGGSFARLSRQDRDHIMALYDGEIASTDRFLGMLFHELRALDLEKKTLVVITSDHGDEFLEHGHTGHGKTLFRELVDIPLIWVEPRGRSRPSTVEDIIQSIDIAPTILNYLGIPAPTTMQGRSLLPVMRGSGLSPMPAYSEVVGFNLRQGRQYAVVSGHKKLILQTKDGTLDAYDLATDPWEHEPRQPSTVAWGETLQTALGQFVRTALLHGRAAGLGSGQDETLEITCELPLNVTGVELEDADVLQTDAHAATIIFRPSCSGADIDGFLVELPVTGHPITIAGTRGGTPMAASEITLGEDAHPERIPFQLNIGDPSLLGPPQASIPRRGFALWTTDAASLPSSPAASDPELEAQLRALGYLE